MIFHWKSSSSTRLTHNIWKQRVAGSRIRKVNMCRFLLRMMHALGWSLTCPPACAMGLCYRFDALHIKPVYPKQTEFKQSLFLLFYFLFLKAENPVLHFFLHIHLQTVGTLTVALILDITFFLLVIFSPYYAIFNWKLDRRLMEVRTISLNVLRDQKSME